MFKRLFKHMRSNSGDSNVSKMTIIAIAFVVGAILLVLTTSAFRNPINRWFDKVTNGWFAEENGMYEADNRFLFAERLENGTIKDATYIYYLDDAKTKWCVLPYVDDVVDGQNVEGLYFEWNALGLAGGTYVTNQYYVDISDDGRQIDIVNIATGEINETYYAEFQD